MKNSRKKHHQGGSEPVRAGSGNVFADLQLEHAPERLAKAELARQIALLIHESGWTQAQAATQLGIDQPKVSALLRGQLRGFSTDRLLRFLHAVGQQVEIVIRPQKSKSPALNTPWRVIRHVA